MNSSNINVVENKSSSKSQGHRFQISYKSEMNSFKILSSLKQDKDVFIEVTSTLQNLPVKQRNSQVLQFLDTVKDMGLVYKYRKFPQSSAQNSIFGFLNLSSSQETHELLACIPHSKWQKDSFSKLLPRFGARYYIINEGENAESLIQDMFDGHLTEDETLQHCSIIAFDSTCLGLMGIITKSMGLAEIKQLVGA